MIDWSFSLAGALTGFIVGLTGVGGGALMTPILLLFFDVSPVTAIATDLWFAAITKIAGAAIHYKAGNVDWQVARRLATGSLPAAFLVVLFVAFGAQIEKVDWLTKAVGILVLVTAFGLFFAPQLRAFATRKRTDQPKHFKEMQPVLTVVAGIFLGICVALTSVGAGALGTVFLLYLYPIRMTPHRLVATDLVHAIPLAIVAGLGYLAAGLVNWAMLLSMLIGSLPAVIMGSWTATKVRSEWVRISLAAVLLMAAIKVLA